VRRLVCWAICLILILSVAVGVSAQQKVVRWLSGETDEKSVALHKQIIEEFEKLNPDIRVELELVATDEREQKIISDLFAGVPVGIIQVDSENIGYYALNGVLLALDDMIAEIGEDDFLPESRFMLNGHDWGMPYAGANIVLWVRTDLLEAAGLEEPKTWDELLEAARVLTTEDRYGIVLPGGQNNCTTLWTQMFINQAGGNVFDEDLNVTLDSPQVVRALEFYKQLAEYAPPGIASYSYGDQINAYVADRVAMAYYQGRMLSRIASDAPHLLEVSKAIKAPIDTTDMNFGSFVYYAIGANCEYPEAAKKFLQFLTTGDRALRNCMTVPGHMAPALRSVRELVATYDDPFVQEHMDTIQFLFDDQSTGFNEVVNSGGIQDNTVVRTGIVNPYYGLVRNYNVLSKMVQEVLYNGTDPAVAAARAQAELEELIREEQQ
jgi:multiple sugar transport system substrate-binding protein